jgi:hypothetical protein
VSAASSSEMVVPRKVMQRGWGAKILARPPDCP